MNVEQKTIDGRTVLHISGRADNATSAAFQEFMDPFLTEDRSDLILDLSDLEYISSAGLRVLLVVARHLAENQGKGVLCGMNDLIKDVLEISGFVSLYEIADSVDSALAAESGSSQ